MNETFRLPIPGVRFAFLEGNMDDLPKDREERRERLFELMADLQWVYALGEGAPQQHTTVTANGADDINRALDEAYEDEQAQPQSQVVPAPPPAAQSAPPKDSKGTTPPPTPPGGTGEQPKLDRWGRADGQTFDNNNLLYIKTRPKGTFTFFDEDQSENPIGSWPDSKRPQGVGFYKFIDKIRAYLPNNFDESMVGAVWTFTEPIGIRTLVKGPGYTAHEKLHYYSNIDAVWPMAELTVGDEEEIPF